MLEFYCGVNQKPHGIIILNISYSRRRERRAPSVPDNSFSDNLEWAVRVMLENFIYWTTLNLLLLPIKLDISIDMKKLNNFCFHFTFFLETDLVMVTATNVSLDIRFLIGLAGRAISFGIYALWCMRSFWMTW